MVKHTRLPSSVFSISAIFSKAPVSGFMSVIQKSGSLSPFLSIRTFPVMPCMKNELYNFAIEITMV